MQNCFLKSVILYLNAYHISGVYESNIFHRFLYFSHERANVSHICACHSRDTWFFIIEVIAMHDTYKFIRKMDDISSCQLLVLRHEGDTILQNEVMFIRRFVGLDAVIPNDLVQALHCHIEDKTFITVDLPLLIIREGTQLEDVAPVHILKDLGIDYIGQCNFVVTFIQRKDDGWLRRGCVTISLVGISVRWLQYLVSKMEFTVLNPPKGFWRSLPQRSL